MNTSSFIKNCTLSLLLFLPLMIAGCTSDGDNCPATYEDLQIVAHWPDGAVIPSGIRVLIYPEGQSTYVLTDLPAEGGKITILTGKYSIIVLNTDSQKIIYSDRDSYTKYNATTSTATVSFPQRPDITKTFASPDHLWLANYDTYEVVQGKTNVIDVYPVERVYQYYIIAPVTGIEYVSSAIAAVTNLKQTVLLSNTDIVPVKGAALLNATRIETGIQFAFRSFGVVTEGTHEITFIINSPSKSYQFNVDITAALNAIPHGGTIYLTEPIEIAPDAMGEGGIDVELGGWDNIPVILPPIIATP